MKAADEGEVYRASKWKPILLLPIFTFFTLGCIDTVAKGAGGIAVAGGAIFFAIGCVVCVVYLLPGSTYLRITEEGFETCVLFRKGKFLWKDVSAFSADTLYTRGPSFTRIVRYNFIPGSDRVRWGSRIFGCSLPDNYGFKAKDLAAFMNERLNQYRAKNGAEQIVSQ